MEDYEKWKYTGIGFLVLSVILATVIEPASPGFMVVGGAGLGGIYLYLKSRKMNPE